MLYRAPVDTSPATEGVTLFKYQLLLLLSLPAPEGRFAREAVTDFWAAFAPFATGFFVSSVFVLVIKHGVFQSVSSFCFPDWTETEVEAESHSQSSRDKGKQSRSQMLCELYRVRKEMVDNSTIVSKPEV